MTHEYTEHHSPINIIVRCSCGWSRTFRRENALARASKIRGALAEHGREVKLDATLARVNAALNEENDDA